jgi:hypothetical protein
MAMYIPVTGGPSNWLASSEVFKSFNPNQFDTDVASPGADIAWRVPAKRHITRDSLLTSWASFGYVWMNAPYNDDSGFKPKRNGLWQWLDKFTKHGNGIALVPDRTSSPWWQEFVPRCDLALFWAPKIKFLIPPDGTPGASPPDGNTLLAMGELGCAALERAAKRGHGVLMRPVVPAPSVITSVAVEAA